MRNRKWCFTALVAVMAFSLLFSACSKSSGDNSNAESNNATEGNTPDAAVESSEPVTIQFWNCWTGPDGVLLKELVDYYNENNTDNVTVEMDIMELDVLSEKMTTALVSNTAPDLYLYLVDGDMIAHDQILAIDDVFDQTDLDRSDFSETTLERCYYNEHLYGLPFQVSSYFFFWNKDLFEAAGLDPDTPPKNWEELKEFSALINDPENNIVGGGFSPSNDVAVKSIILSYGGIFVAEDEDDGLKSMLLEPEYIDGNLEALSFIKEMVDSGTMPAYGGNDYQTMFLAGNCGMLIDGGWMISGCKDAANLNWGVGLIPSGPAYEHAQSGYVAALMVPKGTEGRNLEASYQFMEYWNNNLTNEIIDESPAYQWSAYQGYQSYLYSVANDETLIQDPIFRITNTYLDYLVEEYPVSFYKTDPLRDVVIIPMGENVATSMTPQEALEAADEALNEIIDSFDED